MQSITSLADLGIVRHKHKFMPDARRVLLRPFIPGNSRRTAHIVGRVMSMTDDEVERILRQVLAEFHDRHFDIERVFDRHFCRIRHHMLTDEEPSRPRRLLLGSYFTAEYALESAALFNPSIVPHPDQANVPPGWLRFVMSFRATGEGHISSLEFRTGIVNDTSDVVLDRPGRYVTEPELVPNALYDKSLFVRKLREMGIENDDSAAVLGALPDGFTIAELREAVSVRRNDRAIQPPGGDTYERTVDAIIWLAESNYEVTFDRLKAISERTIFPISASEKNGIEDARFVHFTDDNGEVTYYATYTAWNGAVMLPQLLSTRDFCSFKVVTLNGKAVENKGMALFPRKIDGKFAMISRQDNENLFIMFSEHLHFWHRAEQLLRPSYPWEFTQLGNCGSPIETEAGWLLLTHGVGPVRKYCIGAALLDLADPRRVLGRLRNPLLAPNENEREGYVPNVVYTCGALLHRRQLIIPYAMSDTASSICNVSLDALLAQLKLAGSSSTEPAYDRADVGRMK